MTLIERLSDLITAIKSAIGGLDTRVTVLEDRITVSTTAPESPALNDIWIDVS